LAQTVLPDLITPMSHTEPARGFDAAPAVPAPPCVTASVEEKPTAERLAEWFEQEVHAHDGQLKSWLRGNFPAVHDVDDVVQESYLRLWKARATQPVRSAKAFLFKIARHVAYDLLRRHKTSPVDPLGDLAALHVIDERPDAAEALARQEKLDLLADAVVALPTRCREIVILHKIKGLPQKEVARLLDLSERTVENQCLLALRRCEKYLRAHGLHGFQGQ